MSGIATAVIGSAVIGGVVASNASKNAAQTQANAANLASNTTLQATRESNDLQWKMLQQNLQTQAPYIKGGQTAYAALLGSMGLGGQFQQPKSTIGISNNTPQLGPNGEATGAGGAGMPNTGTGLSGYTPVNYNATPEEMAAASGQYVDANGVGQLTKTFTPSDLTTDPSYQWRLEQGMRALKAHGAATGMLQSGQGLKDINDYAQGAASQEYQAAFDRYNTNQSNLYNRLMGLVAPGSAAATAAGQAGTAAGQTVGSNTMTGVGASNNYLTGGAAASAAGQVGSANAWTGAMNTGVNNWMGLQMLDKYGSGGSPLPATKYPAIPAPPVQG